MEREENKDDNAARDYPALNALVEHLQHFIDGMKMQGASQAQKAKAVGIKHQRDFGKLMQKMHSPGLDKIQAIADKLEVEPWELIQPLNAKPQTRWPFEEIPQERYESLTLTQKGRVQQAMLDMMDRIEREQLEKLPVGTLKSAPNVTHGRHRA